MSTSNGCPNSSNPYHQCTQACSQNSTTKGRGGTKPHPPKRQNNTNTSGYGGGPRSLTTDNTNNNGQRRAAAAAACPKASNPYHNCDDANCNNSAGATPHSKIDHRKKKLGSKPEDPPVLNTVPPTKLVTTTNNISNASSTKPPYSENKNMEPEIHEIVPSNGPISGQSHSPPLMLEDQVKDEAVTELLSNKQEETNKEDKVSSSDETCEEGSKYFSFSGTPLPVDNKEILDNNSSEEETDSVISESRISIGKYNVKESFGSILLTILDKYGDIGASCHLESVVMRSYYMECVCFVVQELQSCSDSITKSKLNELLDIVKDVESAHLRVAWLRIVLDEIAENVEMVSHQKNMEMEKVNYDHEVESLKQQLESELETLAQKEQEVADINMRIPEIKDRLSHLEQLKSSELDDGDDDQTMLPIIKSKIDKLL